LFIASYHQLLASCFAGALARLGKVEHKKKNIYPTLASQASGEIPRLRWIKAKRGGKILKEYYIVKYNYF
jgi:hypothetical protein